jgi:hypothetical protein
MKPTLASLLAALIALPALAQDPEGMEAGQDAEPPASEASDASSLALRGDDGGAVEIDPDDDTLPEADDSAPSETNPLNDATDPPADATPASPEGAPADSDDASPQQDDEVAAETPSPSSAAGDDESASETESDDAPGTEPETPDTAADTEDPALPDDAVLEDDTPPAADGESGADSAPADDAATAEQAEAEAEHRITPSAPFLSSADYLDIRGDSTSEALELVWQVETFTPDGRRLGAPQTRTLIMAPDFVRYERPGATEIFDFAHNRHLQLDTEAGTLTNTAFEGEVRRRLDTYLGLSQAGRLEQIPLGPDRSFDRFWLESAMGIRREPVELDARLEGGELTVERGTGLSLLSASFDIATDNAADEDPAEEPAPEGRETDPVPAANDTAAATTADDIAAMATPIDLASGESVVFDPSQAAAPITLEDESVSFSWPDAAPEEQAQAELLRRWMRHALPLHPDALATLRGAPRIPDQFAYFIVSPDSPDGRREIWTLEQSGTAAPGLRLEPGLMAQAGRPELLGQVVAIAAAAAEQSAPDDADILDAIETYRDNGDPARAYLAVFHETSRNGPCPPPGQSGRRDACVAASSVVAGGLGNPSFETVFSAIEEIGEDRGDTILAALSPYLEEDSHAGAAARTIVANELLAWAARDPDGPPADIDPFELLVESIAIDPHAGANYRYLGNALLNLRNPVGAWTVYDAGRAVPGAAENADLVQLSALEDRLRALAPDFFLPR